MDQNNKQSTWETKVAPEPTNKNWIIIIAIAIIGVGIYSFINSDSNKEEPKATDTTQQVLNFPVDNSSAKSIDNTGSRYNVVKLNDTLRTEYFDIVASKVKAKTKLIPGWPYDNVLAGKDEMFVVFRATFKNIDNESRMVEAGQLLINYNGKDYQFDEPETINVPGFGLFLDQINPLITKRTTLVYKMPANIKGDLYWHPGRTKDNEVIFLGKLNY